MDSSFFLLAPKLLCLYFPHIRSDLATGNTIPLIRIFSTTSAARYEYVTSTEGNVPRIICPRKLTYAYEIFRQ